MAFHRQTLKTIITTFFSHKFWFNLLLVCKYPGGWNVQKNNKPNISDAANNKSKKHLTPLEKIERLLCWNESWLWNVNIAPSSIELYQSPIFLIRLPRWLLRHVSSKWLPVTRGARCYVSPVCIGCKPDTVWRWSRIRIVCHQRRETQRGLHRESKQEAPQPGWTSGLKHAVNMYNTFCWQRTFPHFKPSAWVLTSCLAAAHRLGMTSHVKWLPRQLFGVRPLHHSSSGASWDRGGPLVWVPCDGRILPLNRLAKFIQAWLH